MKVALLLVLGAIAIAAARVLWDTVAELTPYSDTGLALLPVFTLALCMVLVVCVITYFAARKARKLLVKHRELNARLEARLRGQCYSANK